LKPTPLEIKKSPVELPERKKVILFLSVKVIDLMKKICDQRGWHSRSVLVETAVREWEKRHEGEIG
jgi:hypothetical protein